MSRRAGSPQGRLLRAVLLALVAALLAAAAKPPDEYLDEDTAATLTIVAEPLVFACDRRDLGAYARDYVTLAAVSVNRNRKVDYLLLAYFWSTVAPHLRPDALPAPELLVLLADDRRIELHRGARTARDAGISVLIHPPPATTAGPLVYPTDLATLRFLAESRQLKVLSDSAATPTGFGLWDDERDALRAFVQHLDVGP